jgi:hypothetical protein
MPLRNAILFLYVGVSAALPAQDGSQRVGNARCPKEVERQVPRCTSGRDPVWTFPIREPKYNGGAWFTSLATYFSTAAEAEKSKSEHEQLAAESHNGRQYGEVFCNACTQTESASNEVTFENRREHWHALRDGAAALLKKVRGDMQSALQSLRAAKTDRYAHVGGAISEYRDVLAEATTRSRRLESFLQQSYSKESDPMIEQLNRLTDDLQRTDVRLASARSRFSASVQADSNMAKKRHATKRSGNGCHAVKKGEACPAY